MKQLIFKQLYSTIFITLFSFFATNLYAQKKGDFLSEYSLYKISDKKLGEIQIGVLKGSDMNQHKPLLLFIEGSGRRPAFVYVKSTDYVASTAFSNVLENYKDKYHIVYVNKAGIPLFDTIATPTYDPARYQGAFATANTTKDWRVQSAVQAIDFLVKTLPVTPGKIYVVGHSEGGGVAAKVAEMNKKVTKVVVMNTHALNHIYDFVLDERQKVATSKIPPAQAQVVIDSLYQVQQDIFADPLSVTKEWSGWSYKRWYSYLKETPLENMLALSIPILNIASGKDINTNVASADYTPLEFARRGKTNLTYKVYPDHDHSHFIITRDANGKRSSVYKGTEVFADVFQWLEK